jgi:CheY-like chemotaxis protein
MANPHALIIDDDMNNLGILVEMLALEGVESTSIQDPTQVEAILEEIPALDLVFLDLEMPGLNGYDILEILKAKDQVRDVPIVAYTVHVSEINAARQLGFHSFLGKPLNADTFSEQLTRLLNNQPVWEA